MNRLELQQYVERLGLVEVPAATIAGLTSLQRAHLAHVPFENLDVVEGLLPLALDEGALFDKIVRRRRGGICYELNLLFAAALRAAGFEVALKGGRHPKYGDDMDHLFLLVDMPGDAPEGGPWLADVGFASNFAEPLRFAVGEMQDDGVDRYVLDEAPEVGEGYVRLSRIAGLSGEVAPVEMFAFGPREFAAEDCRARCDWFCTSPESRFTQGPLVTLQGEGGRRTLSARHYIETRGGERATVDVRSPEQFNRYLREMLA